MTQAQNTNLIVDETIKLPDSNEKMIEDLNGFLTAANGINEKNKFVLQSQKIETFILLDEIFEINKSYSQKDDNFYKAHLNNILELGEGRSLIQVSYIGQKDATSILRATFEFIAHKTDGGFLFSSPLKRNTRHWKSLSKGDVNFIYRSQINFENANSHAVLSGEFDEKLGNVGSVTQFYLGENSADVLKLIGVLYKLDYNGRQELVLSSQVDKLKLVVMGTNNQEYNEYDGHDLWHSRLSMVKPRRTLHKPLDEGLAYLYAGSWGFTWEDIFTRFMEEVASDLDSNWLNYKENPYDFGESKATHLYVDYVINALLAQKIEKEQGFDAVMELLEVGPFENGNEAFYKKLEEISGITKDTYNREVWQLIEIEGKKGKYKDLLLSKTISK